jgi:hypothetical protein
MSFDDQNRQCGKGFVVPPSGGYAGVKPPEGGTTENYLSRLSHFMWRGLQPRRPSLAEKVFI